MSREGRKNRILRRVLVILIVLLLLAGLMLGGWLIYVHHIKSRWVDPLLYNSAFRPEYDSVMKNWGASAGPYHVNGNEFTFYEKIIVTAQHLRDNEKFYINIIYRCDFWGKGSLEIMFSDNMPSDIPGQMFEEINHFQVQTNAELEYLNGIGGDSGSSELYDDAVVREAFERFKPDIRDGLKEFFTFFGRENFAL